MAVNFGYPERNGMQTETVLLLCLGKIANFLMISLRPHLGYVEYERWLYR